ncbi:ribonuclease P protein subunit p29 [Aplysia californica]|uniref:Ribonuclease P protein subunit p29 n=1 Tax=Aplysia californica TaxID=6500 RepID=A0ABM0JDQ5_APLCA|nr:ribonuclease P protein subunit p29 [Aplysia californica]XP_005091315.1 ribonuclease P protein subunit p29 [Aplysia californica]XP_012945804.1 ribonuclease P protein subunit p29 [Aplysia californica]
MDQEPSAKDLTVTNAEAYQELSQADLGGKANQMSSGARTTYVTSFLGKHLPTNRLKTDTDLSAKFESVDCSRRRKKKRGKSKAGVGARTKVKAKLDWKLECGKKTSYSTYLPLKEMWTKYIEELIQFSSSPNLNLPAAAQKMMKADLHGCPLSVRKSKCPSYIGVSGIVIQETRNMFVLVTPCNEIKSIPKANSIFTIVLHDYVFTIHGNQFIVKPGDRAAKKFKTKPSLDL